MVREQRLGLFVRRPVADGWAVGWRWLVEAFETAYPRRWLVGIVVVLVAGTLGYAWVSHPSALGFVGAWRWYAMVVVHDGLGLDVGGVPVTTTSGLRFWSAERISTDAWHIEQGTRLGAELRDGATITAGGAVALVILGLVLGYRRDRRAHERVVIGPGDVVEERVLARLARRRRPSDLRVGRVAVPTDRVGGGLLCLGASATGKTTLLRSWLETIARRGEIAVVIDPVGEVSGGLFAPACGDVTLMVQDGAASAWSPWAAMDESADARRLARALIPDGADAGTRARHARAQALFAALLVRVARRPERSVERLVRTALLTSASAKAALLAPGERVRRGELAAADAAMAVFAQALALLPETSGGAGDLSIDALLADLVAGLDGGEDWARRRLVERQSADHARLMAARARLACGEGLAAFADLERIGLVWPLLPEGVAPPLAGEDGRAWWRRHEAVLSAHWRVQDRAMDLAEKTAQDALAARLAGCEGRRPPWLFLGADRARLAAAGPLVAMQAEAAVAALLRLGPRPDRATKTVWLVIDALERLPALPSLPDLVAVARSKGVSVCLGVRDLAPVEAAYGTETARHLLGAASVKAVFFPERSRTAVWASQALGLRSVPRDRWSGVTAVDYRTWRDRQHALAQRAKRFEAQRGVPRGAWCWSDGDVGYGPARGEETYEPIVAPRALSGLGDGALCLEVGNGLPRGRVTLTPPREGRTVSWYDAARRDGRALSASLDARLAALGWSRLPAETALMPARLLVDKVGVARAAAVRQRSAPLPGRKAAPVVPASASLPQPVIVPSVPPAEPFQTMPPVAVAPAEASSADPAATVPRVASVPAVATPPSESDPPPVAAPPAGPTASPPEATETRTLPSSPPVAQEAIVLPAASEPRPEPTPPVVAPPSPPEQLALPFAPVRRRGRPLRRRPVRADEGAGTDGAGKTDGRDGTDPDGAA